jgi:hypothetical protein
VHEREMLTGCSLLYQEFILVTLLVNRLGMICSPMSHINRLGMMGSPMSHINRLGMMGSPMSHINRLGMICSPMSHKYAMPIYESIQY